MVSDIIYPPWTDEQVDGLNKFQALGQFHPFTCRDDECRAGRPDPRSRYANLRATPDGWVCDWCGQTQNWAFAGMPELGLNPPKPWWLVGE